MKLFIIIIILLSLLIINCSETDKRYEEKGYGSFEMIKDTICRIDKNRHDQLEMVTYNPAINGMKDKYNFTDDFKSEIREVDKLFSDYFNKYGKFGSYDRYCDKKPSDWWIDDDGYSTNRVLFIELLNPKLQKINIIKGAQKILYKIKNDWMLRIGHKNLYNASGEYVGLPGEYYFWVTKSKIEIYSEKDDDILILLKSLKVDSLQIENDN
jgi:hypothetical protein